MSEGGELLIEIRGSTKDFLEALEQTKDKVGSLTNNLKLMAGVSAAAYAGFITEIGFSVKAYGEQEKATNQLIQSMKNQGIYSKELLASYKEQDEEIERRTGIQADEIESGQALLQGYVGQIKITKELTQAVVDFATAQHMDLQSAFSVVGKSISGTTNALGRYGIEIDTSKGTAEKMADITKALSDRFNGQAEAANQGVGSLHGLETAFKSFQENIGKQFAPLIESAAKSLTSLFYWFSDEHNREVTNLVVAILAGATAASGIALAISGAGLAFLKFKEILEVAKIATDAMSLATKGLVGATGLGLLVIALVEIYQHWSDILPVITGIYRSFVQNISALAGGLGKILLGALTFDKEKFNEGLDQLKSALAKGMDDYRNIANQKRQQIASDQKKADSAELAGNRKLASDKNLVLTESEIALQKAKDKIHKKEIEEQANHNAEFLENEVKFGTAYAALKLAIESRIYQGMKSALSDLASLQQSHNETLKAIGKAAAVANIVMKTAESAMNIYAGFSTIPIIGPALGIAGAAAAIAYGAEQIGTVLSAAKGGLVEGGIPGMDSVPAYLMPGELVVPKNSYEEVVGAVAASRQGQAGSQSQAAPTGYASVDINFKPKQFMDWIEARLVERRALNLSLAGAR